MIEKRVAAAFDGIDVEELPDSVDKAAVERVRRVAYLLDESIPVPLTGYRVGVDPLLSAVPGVGDALSAAVSLYIVAESARLGVSFTTLLRMLATVTLDTAGGIVPVVGPVFDAVFKANKRNVEALLDEIAPEATEAAEADDGTDGVTIDVTSPDGG
ncbi:DUF4112 domain-containing protein [Halolamina sp.]|jgi:hypothetical protein|uniref:DUF4112 domain-containing protein n=1 Tax=Halolamina sp. TaxID=1940283 RepID=UPI000223B923|nr:hypothetical protein Halar_1493 [halophilic archaeon DL31]